jgi:hypothetical protein
MKWTDADMIRFAIFCANYGDIGYIKRTGRWHMDDAVDFSTEELLKFYQKQQIPSLPSPDDLKDIKLGPENS